MSDSKKSVVNMSGIIKRFYIGMPNELQILNGIDLDIKEGEFVAIVGESGSGKSTMMNIIGALDRPTEGKYFFNGEDISKLSDKKLSKIRNKEIGFVFQNFNLVPRTSALKNVELPMMYAGIKRRERTKRAKELLKTVGMEERSDHNPNELSGGQKQRVAIARAMANDPSIILADEPTGALDTKTGRIVMDIFHELHRSGKTIILITHSPELAKETERIITISDGNIISDTAGGAVNGAD
ncbi:MAG: ABC transporter ATP-binding protein [Oscillospiraceae bacterium]|nr:ABC transporter ATP-binding protein [Ruminococcus sp.]MBP1565095.1 ABC transporter ATP-binding protein [Oscillospiraceae bacterium]MBQ9981629.1 ABC transporter ATP-binding protein [Oscillospiraceae bacterium]